jgi:hypothetical protein
MKMTRNSRADRATMLRRRWDRGFLLSRFESKWRQVRARLEPVIKVGFCIGVATTIVVSLLPADYVPVIMNDKLEHLLVYALLGWLGTWIFQTRRAMALLVVSLCALSVVLEAGQQFSPGRSMELADAVASCFGACIVPAVKFLISLRLI